MNQLVHSTAMFSVRTCFLSSEDGHTRVIKGLSTIIIKWAAVYKKAHLVLKEIAYTLLHHCLRQDRPTRACLHHILILPSKCSQLSCRLESKRRAVCTEEFGAHFQPLRSESTSDSAEEDSSITHLPSLSPLLLLASHKSACSLLPPPKPLV